MLISDTSFPEGTTCSTGIIAQSVLCLLQISGRLLRCLLRVLLNALLLSYWERCRHVRQSLVRASSGVAARVGSHSRF